MLLASRQVISHTQLVNSAALVTGLRNAGLDRISYFIHTNEKCAPIPVLDEVLDSYPEGIFPRDAYLSFELECLTVTV